MYKVQENFALRLIKFLQKINKKIFAANKNKFHCDKSMYDKLLEYYDIRYQITNPIQANPRARQSNDLDLVGNELLLHCLCLSHLPSQHVFPRRFCLLSWNYEIFLLHTFSLDLSFVFKCVYLCSLFQGHSHIWTYLLFGSSSSGSNISICSYRPPTKLKPVLLHPLLVPILPQLRHLCCKKWTVQVTIVNVLKVRTIARRVYNINRFRNAYIRYLRKHLPCIFSR